MGVGVQVPGVVRAVLYAGLCVGLVPYRPRHRSLHLPSALHSLAVAFLVLQSCLSCLEPSAAAAAHLSAYGLLVPLHTALNSLITVTCVLAVLYHYPLWLRLLDGLAWADRSLRPTHSAPVLIQAVGIPVAVALACAHFLAFFRRLASAHPLGWLMAIGQSLATAVDTLLVVEFLTYVLLLDTSFRALNRSLEAGGSVSVAREAHHRLCALCTVARHAFGPQLLASVAKAVLLITVTLYSLSLAAIGKGPADPTPLYLAVLGATLAHNTIQLMALVFVCATASQQANYTSVLVHKLLNKPLPSATVQQLQLFSYQLLHQKVSFSVCGFFNLDFTLLNGVIASVATYLVILIQFQM